jgi:YidC/Oxa1 family membrane protein insertase
VDFYSFAPIATILDLAYAALTTFITLITPFAGGLAAALGIVTLTLIVRLALIPVGLSQVRAEYTRRRLAPMLAQLKKRYGKKPELLQQKTLELYREQNASPFAGLLPALAQAPVLSIVYGLFIVAVINGHANALLDAQLFGVSLGTSLVGGGHSWPGILVFAAVLLVIALVAFFSRRVQLRFAGPVDASAAGAASAAALGRWLSWLPFITVIFAGIVPLAAALYLAITTTWTLVERAILRRALAPREQPA